MATTTGRLPDEHVGAVLDHLQQVDSVELKLTVPEPAHRFTVEALGLDPLQARIRQVFFFDTPDLALSERGLVVRARRDSKKGDDTVVKLRPVVPSALPDSVRGRREFAVELDAAPGGTFVVSASLKGTPDEGVVRAVALGEQRLRKLFSKAQRRLFEAYAPEGIELDGLSVLGPLLVLKLKSSPPDFGRPLVAELWLYPDGSRILELSTKCAPSEAFEVAAEARAFLSGRGIDLGGEQQLKTRAALEYFSQNLAAATAAR